jgi:hypothetical protein
MSRVSLLFGIFSTVRITAVERVGASILGIPMEGGAVLVQAFSPPPAFNKSWCSSHVSLACHDNEELTNPDKYSLCSHWDNAEDAVYSMPLVSNSLATSLVRTAEAYSSDMGGWTQARHSTFPTRDIPVSLFPNQTLVTEVFDIIQNQMLPAVGCLYDLQTTELSIKDIFVVKYDARREGSDNGALQKLEPHTDGSDISFNVLLSNRSDFEGGGTSFEFSEGNWSPSYSPTTGSALIHRGSIRHQGVEITQGVRYLLVGFLKKKLPHLLELNTCRGLSRDARTQRRRQMRKARDEQKKANQQGETPAR